MRPHLTEIEREIERRAVTALAVGLGTRTEREALALLDSLSLARSELATVKVARDSRTHPGMTHHAGCYTQHHGCAIGEVERLRAYLTAIRDRVGLTAEDASQYGRAGAGPGDEVSAIRAVRKYARKGEP